MNQSWQNLNDLIDYSAGGIVSRELIKTAQNDVTLFCLAAKTAIAEHTATREGFVYVVEGNGSFNLAGEEIPMKPGTLIPMAENAVHSLKAEEDTAFILTLINSPC